MSAYRIATYNLRTVPLLDVAVASPTVKTFAFKDRLCASAVPGQFLMFWVPGVDEIPLSILDVDGNVSVAVKNVGEATRALHSKRIGDLVGVRGPFGNNFGIRGGKVLMVGGGTGIAPLWFLARKLASKARVTFVMGAKTEAELLFMDKFTATFRKDNFELVTSTEDGTCGITGLCTEPVERILAADRFDVVYACGPEQMIVKVFELAEKCGVWFEASLERLMRCAVGLCGSCVIGKYRVCRDGPVFNSGQLNEVKEEFGKWKRDFYGKLMPV